MRAVAKEETRAALMKAVNPAVIIESRELSHATGADIIIVSETFQKTGSFKFRAAYNLVSQVPEDMLITASSGNFGQALACASSRLGKQCIVVMPAHSARVKIDATRSYGAKVDLIDTAVTSRAERLAELSEQYPTARLCSAYDDPLVVEGNASLALEIAQRVPSFDCVVVPVGGGGLASGIVSGLREAGRSDAVVIGAEPLSANDAATSFKAKRLTSLAHEPETIADGARTVSLGKFNWEILRQGLSDIIEVPEALIAEAVRMFFYNVNLKVEADRSTISSGRAQR